MKAVREFYVTILDGIHQELILNLEDFGKDTVTFGKYPENDIVLKSAIVSRMHGHFSFDGEGWQICDDNSTNGLIWNDRKVTEKRLLDGDKLRIGREGSESKVAFLFSGRSPRDHYSKLLLSAERPVTIGRSAGCDVVVNYASVYKVHARIIPENGGFSLERAAADASVQLNGTDLEGRRRLEDTDRFLIGDTQFIYQGGFLHFIRISEGLSFAVSGLARTAGRGKKKKAIISDITFSVGAGEFVAIIGGSGAGKSTLLNCLCGASGISEGSVTIGGEDLTANYSSLKHLIGYVPQQDIVYDDLTLEKMLYYTAKLRMPDDAGEEEIRERIDSALEMVELTERRKLLIRKLSGGQKKRASIAVELLSDPKLFFLDEPTSGLDPGTERSLMLTLREMTRRGRTVVLVTHTPLNLMLCDRIIVMGTGGHLCFSGDPEDALSFFGVSEFTDIYDLINRDARHWAGVFSESTAGRDAGGAADGSIPVRRRMRSRVSGLKQLLVLIRRYTALLCHDVRRLLIQLLMAPGLGLLLYAAFRDSYPFEAAYDTQKFALTLACCAFWIGLFNTIQEICKESRIYRRERMASLKLFPYVGSKLLVNALMNLLQSLLLLGTVGLLLHLPSAGMQLPGAPGVELFLTTYLNMLSAGCLGLAVSACVSNADQAVSAAPLLLIPQILFSGVIVSLQGIIRRISYLISCRYACVAYCTTADINNLPSAFRLTGLGMEAEETVYIDSIYSFTSGTSPLAERLFGESFAQRFTNPVAGGWLALLFLSLAAAAVTLAVLKYKSRVK